MMFDESASLIFSVSILCRIVRLSFFMQIASCETTKNKFVRLVTIQNARVELQTQRAVAILDYESECCILLCQWLVFVTLGNNWDCLWCATHTKTWWSEWVRNNYAGVISLQRKQLTDKLECNKTIMPRETKTGLYVVWICMFLIKLMTLIMKFEVKYSGTPQA